MSERNRRWSDILREATRKALEDIIVTPDGIIHMKHIDGRYGGIAALSLLREGCTIVLTDGSREHFADIEALIDAGWVID